MVSFRKLRQIVFAASASVLVMVSSVNADGEAESSKLVELTAGNFYEKLNEFPEGALVKFYAPWCTHCKDLAPILDDAHTKLHDAIAAGEIAELNDAEKVPLAKFDATTDEEIAQKFEIQGYPTLKWLKAGSVEEKEANVIGTYEGAREPEAVVDFVKTMVKPSIESESRPDGSEKLSVVYKGKEITEEFKKIADSNRTVAKFFFEKTDDEKTSVVIKHAGEEKIEKEISAEESLTALYGKHSLPKVGELNAETFVRYQEVPLVWTLLDMGGADDEAVKTTVEENMEMMQQVANSEAAQKAFGEEGPGFAVTWTNTAQYATVMEGMFGVKEFPVVIAQHLQPKDGGAPAKFFLYKPEDGGKTLEASKVIEFLEKLGKGEIAPHLKSEGIPTEEEQAQQMETVGIPKAVGKNLQEKLFQDDKDVMVEVMAPWCGHCKKLEPELRKVIKKIHREGVQSMVEVYQLDGTLNDSPIEGVSWTGFPTIFYAKAGEKTATVYDGSRDAKGIWKFFKENSAKKEEIEKKVEENKAKRAEEKEQKSAAKEEGKEESPEPAEEADAEKAEL